MSSAILTIIGLYNYDHTLFDNMIMPEGIDRDLVIDAIIMRGGEYEVIYSDPILLKSLIGSWSRQWHNVFANWLRANDEIDVVNPLYNYDRLEDWSDSSATHSTSHDTMEGTGSTSGEDSTTGSNSTNVSGSNSTNVSGSVTDTHKISAEDSNDFVNKTQDLQTNTSNTSETNTSSASATTTSSANTSTSSSTNTENNATSDGTVNSSHTGHLRGNIGVTTSAQMFAEWVQVLRDNGNIYDSIAYVFCNNFVIPIL